MSNPSNVLSSYRSYAYHHILVICDSTQTAEELAISNEIVQFEHPKKGDKYNIKSVSLGGTGGKYVVLINGMTDTTFVINSAKWETVISPNSTTADGMSLSTMIQLDGEMEIIEPIGANFLNILSQVSDALNSDPMGLVFMLKTVFMGYKDDNTNTPDMITTVRPLLFSPIDISAVFDHTGSKYLIAFVGINNGTAKLAPVANIGGGQSIYIKKDQTLKEVFENLTKTINTSYYGFLLMTQKRFNDAGIDFDLSKNFRLVTYKIDVDPGFENFRAGTNEHVRISETTGDPIVHFSDGLGVEEIITKIMMSSAEVVAGKPDVIFKVSSSIDSTPTEYTVTYHIHRYELKTMTVNNATNKVEPDDGQYIEFDYIFTGKNIDIIDFDIRMELGMAFFQTLVTAESIPTQQNALTGQNQDIASGSGGGLIKASSTNKPRTNSPLFLGSSVADRIIRNVKKPVDTLGFQAMLNRHAAIENIQAKMTIYGNPQLMNEMLILPSELSTSGQIETPKKDQTINPRWVSSPTLIKVNIRTPNDVDNPSSGYSPFWYEGFYSLYAVNSVFENGEFTQILDMFSLPVVDDTSKRTDEQTDVTTPLGINQQTIEQIVDAQQISSPEQALAALNEVLQQTQQTSTTDAAENNVSQITAIRNANKEG